MCGRYYIAAEDRDLAEILEAVEFAAAVKTGEIAPSDPAPVLRSGGEITAMRWGYPRFDGKGLIINARSETAAEKAMFRGDLRTGRCLVPASWYFEWEKRRDSRIRYRLRPREAGPVWLAGLSRRERDGEYRFVILTRAASPDIAFIHERMPVILPRRTHDAWLHGGDPAAALQWAEEQLEFAEG